MKNIKLDSHLAIIPEKIKDVLEVRENAIISGIDIDDAINRRATKFKDVKGDVVVVPIHGFISHRETVWSAVGLESSSETIGKWIDMLTDNPAVGAIVLDVNSPGGTAAGLSSVSDKIYNARSKKKIVAVVNDLMASAAYFIGSAAEEIVADPDSLTGSIGTVMMHADYSKALEEAGINVTFIHAGDYKVEANPYEPLSDEAKVRLQSVVDSYYETFVSAVARNRNTNKTQVKADYGKGRVLTAAEARSVGMVDRIGTMQEVIESMKPKQNSNRLRGRAAAIKARNL